MMPFEYLTKEEREAIVQAFEDADIEYDEPLRARLLDGIDRKFRTTFLKSYDEPGDQLFFDLQKMNLVDRLSDGTVPLAAWLGNAIRRFRIHGELGRLLESMMAKVAGRQHTAEPIAKTQVPELAANEEVITEGVDDLLEVSFLPLGAACVPAVGKILVPYVLNGNVGLLTGGEVDLSAGTGWLIASNLVMTNYHVIRLRPRGQEPAPVDLQKQIEQATINFSQNEENKVGQKLSFSRLIAAGRTPESDYALLELADTPQCPPLRLSFDRVVMPPPVPTPKGTAIKLFGVNIIQHPMGKAKCVALRNNRVYSADYPFLYYYTDTLEGSSGSPVFDDSWRVIALHRASIQERSEYNGNKNVGYVNQGVQINAIFAHLAETAKSEPVVADALLRIKEDQNLS
jgi:endonuclease G, mitochondrial